MTVLQTERLTLRWLCADDAPFILDLLNDPSWLRFVGDKGVRTLQDARDYIEKGPVAMVRDHGIGLHMTELTDGRVPIGICGLIKRDSLPDVDLGFALLPTYRGRGYAFEAAQATLRYGIHERGLRRIVAITSLDNDRSIKLLEKLGFVFERTIQVAGGEDLRLFAYQASSIWPDGPLRRCPTGVRPTSVQSGLMSNALPSVTVQQVMTPHPVTAALDTPVPDAIELMEQVGCRHLPVVAGGELVGVVSKKAVSCECAQHRQVGEVMSSDVPTAKPGDAIEQAAATMALSKVDCLPVLEGGQLVGIITTYDVLDLLCRRARQTPRPV